MAIPPPSTVPRRSSCLTWLVAGLVLALVAVCVPSALVAGAVAVSSGDWPLSQATLTGLLSLLLVLLLAPLARLTHNPGRRAIFRAWLLAAPFPTLLLPTLLVPPVRQQLAVLLQIALAWLYLLLLSRLLGRAGDRKLSGAGLPAALALTALLALPWLAWGALGSSVDILLSLLAGLLLGRIAALIFVRSWLPVQDSPPSRRDLLAGGGVLAVVLLILASNYGFNGAALPLMLGLPPVAWLALLLNQPLEADGHNGAGAFAHGDAQARSQALAQGIGWVVGLAAALPLLFSDSDTLSLVALFSGAETIVWSLLAAGVSAGLATLLTIVAFIRPPRLLRPQLALLAAGIAWLLGALLYAFAGTPGFYGDRLFVILKDQADVQAAARIADYDSRRRFVYQKLTTHADTTQAALRATLDRSGLAYTPYYLVNALEVDDNPLLRLWLWTRPEVDRVLPSPRLRPLPMPMPVARGNTRLRDDALWNLALIGAPRVWQELGVTGEKIVIGQSDSGVAWGHPELRAAYRGVAGDTARHDYNWFDPWQGELEPTDRNGHGTHTLGIALGNTVGVAPGASWIGCKNLARNVGNAARYLDCLQFMLAPFPLGGDPLHDGDPTRAAHVLNNSWGCPQTSEGCDALSLLPAVRALRAAGIFVVASAGNEGPECSSIADPLAIYAEVFSVGAVDASGNVTAFSSAGPVTVDGSGRVKPDIAAPGADILSAYPDGGFARASGTSQAGPHVAGVVALLWSANPDLIGDIDTTTRILTETVRPYQIPDPLPLDAAPLCATGLGGKPNNIVGYGIVDAYTAVQRALQE